jgi:alkanesulfonate monooxygenase
MILSQDTHIAPQVLWVLPSTGDSDYLGTPVAARPPDRNLVWQVVQALEAHAFDGVLITTGHVNNHFGVDAPYLECLTTAALVAAISTRLKLLVAVRPGLVHPAMAARALATLDVLSEGRVMLNLVSGGAPLAMYGERLTREEIYARSSEFVSLIRELWKGGPADYEGRFYSARGAVCYPRPVQTPHPPVFVAGRSAEAIDLMLREGDVAAIPGCTLASAAGFIDDVKSRLQGASSKLEFALHLYVIARKTNEEALAAADRLVSRVDQAAFMQSRRSIFRLPERKADLVDDPAESPEQIAPGQWNHLKKLSREPTPMLIGSYQEVAGTLLRYRDLGFRWIILQSYPMAAEIARFGTEVLPLLRKRTGSGQART